MRPPRGLLFVPGDRPERFDKARASGADAVVIDLEDAVAPDHKPAARDALADWLDNWVDNRPDPAPPARWLLRVNATDTRWFDDDVRLAAHPALSAVMLPKAARADEVAALRARCGGKPVLPLVETAAGVAAARALAAAPGVAQLVFGTVDLQLDLDLDEADAPDVLLPHAAALVLASRLARLPGPVDGVSLVLDDAERLAAQSRRARAMGFAGKLCIHPRQVAVVQAAWTPTPAQRDWARRVLEAAAQAAGGAFSVDGRMVDAPVLARARRLCEEVRGPR